METLEVENWHCNRAFSRMVSVRLSPVTDCVQWIVCLYVYVGSDDVPATCLHAQDDVNTMFAFARLIWSAFVTRSDCSVTWSIRGRVNGSNTEQHHHTFLQSYSVSAPELWLLHLYCVYYITLATYSLYSNMYITIYRNISVANIIFPILYIVHVCLSEQYYV